MSKLSISKITTHMQTDPNAMRHAVLGWTSSMLASTVGTFFISDTVVYLLAIVLASLVTGVLIEIAQRVQRSFYWKKLQYLGISGAHQNTFTESVLDVFQTWWYPVTVILNFKK